MKKAYRIETSRYPAQNAMLGSPEQLNQAYETIQQKWVHLPQAYIAKGPGYLLENYVNNSNFARVIKPNPNSPTKDVISIDLGTQLKIEDLKRLSRRLGLPFDEKEVRRE